MLSSDERSNASFRNLRVFCGLHSGHADCTDNMAFCDERHATLKSRDKWSGAKSRTPTINHFFVCLRFTPTKRCSAGFTDGDFGTDSCTSVETKHAEQMTTIVYD